ncbi:hypothetical protein MmTuc01_2839 [Methanosarcina mazei Tuc01]|uniref:Uncharacterized protein n=1 Tax=Methanosarcina mazei Tuc01 TaxID=1236903 RepID=M1QM59_METMZ|nr:hypothetical protein MmTuc01_2839 [Methanosarcina mazei Tuc01]
MQGFFSNLFPAVYCFSSSILSLLFSVHSFSLRFSKIIFLCPIFGNQDYMYIFIVKSLFLLKI